MQNLYLHYFDDYRELSPENKSKPSKILDDLYLSGENVISNKDVFGQLDISAVVGIHEENFTYPNKVKNIHRIHVEDLSNEDYTIHFNEFLKFMRQQQKESRITLIHCRAGSSRSVGFCMLWLMSNLNWSLEESLKHIHDIRPIACPNFGFLTQLQAWKKQ